MSWETQPEEWEDYRYCYGTAHVLVIVNLSYWNPPLLLLCAPEVTPDEALEIARDMTHQDQALDTYGVRRMLIGELRCHI